MSLGTILFYVIVAAIPAYFFNKWMLRVTRPRESFARLFLYMLLSIAVAIAYATLFIFIITTIYPLPKK